VPSANANSWLGTRAGPWLVRVRSCFPRFSGCLFRDRFFTRSARGRGGSLFRFFDLPSLSSRRRPAHFSGRAAEGSRQPLDTKMALLNARTSLIPLDAPFSTSPQYPPTVPPSNSICAPTPVSPFPHAGSPHNPIRFSLDPSDPAGFGSS